MKQQMSGCSTAMILVVVGVLAVPVGMSLPPDMLGMLFGILLGLIVLIPISAVLMMAMQTRHREEHRRVHVQAEREIEQIKAQLPAPAPQPRQWVIVGNDWATTPQQSAFHSNAVTLNAVRRERRVPVHDVYEPVSYYEEVESNVEREAIAVSRRTAARSKSARPVTQQVTSLAPRALQPARATRNFTITGQVRRTDMFRVVGE